MNKKDVPLTARTARDARIEISNRWPTKDVNYTGFDRNGEAVMMSLVRRRGFRAHVATVTKNRALPAVKFMAHVPE